MIRISSSWTNSYFILYICFNAKHVARLHAIPRPKYEQKSLLSIQERGCTKIQKRQNGLGKGGGGTRLVGRGGGGELIKEGVFQWEKEILIVGVFY